ncbi:TonB-dependent receptor plug domain-containing protein [Sunxiuqinia sp. A32]|uniref:TonB-dependent receptor plug domain-containing protein n=1 Tax=Sunxiuqinia sp. A32 TaxID=3461496 RepID=UPI0040459467
MKRFVYAIFLSILFVSFTPKSDLADFEQFVFSQFTEHLSNSLQEKVYLQTDKPYYSAGEDIWFKGYLVNAALNTPNSLSNYLYVELVNKSDSLISRIKVRKDSCGFAGNIKLKPELSTGYYALRAYTNWMQNTPSDFYFSKNIYIGNTIDDQVLCEINYGIVNNGKVPVSISFKDSEFTPLRRKDVVLNESWKNAKKDKLSFTTDSEGIISYQMEIDSENIPNKYIEVSINEDALKWNKKLFIPEFSEDFDVQFFPEGGNLLPDIMQVIGVKAIGADGLSVEISGKIFTNDDELVTEFSTWHNGMGKCVFKPNAGERYYALVKMGNGVERRFYLPKLEEKGIGIHLVSRKGKILYQVYNQSDVPNNSLFILAHVRGMVYALQPLGDLMSGQIDESLFPAGIVTFSIVDIASKVYAERLFFKIPEAFPIVNLQSDKRVYGRREPVRLDIAVKSSDGEPVVGNFSLSVTDSRTVKQDTLTDNIISNLLLSSDIKGYIEEPASYFTDQSHVGEEKLDLLMLTQGWRRFKTEDVLKGEIFPPTHYMEASQVISGRLKNTFGKAPKTNDVYLYSDYKDIFRKTKSDDEGRYYFDGLEFPDSTYFMVKAERKKSLTEVKVVPEILTFEDPKCFIPIPRARKVEIPEEYFQQSKEKYFYEGGMRVINLDEVTVTAEEKEKNVKKFYYSGAESAKLSREDVDKYPSMGAMDLIDRLPGVNVSGDHVMVRSFGDAIVLIDGIVAEIDFVKGFTARDIEEVAVFKDSKAAMFGSRGANGAVAITLRRGAERGLNLELAVNTERIMPMGYQKKSEFYVPKYQVESVRNNSQPDYRTTIYWNPGIDTDSTGVAHVKFYTADMPNDYHVVLEGISTDGEICRYTGKLTRN